jgi:hypothetical protein
VLLLLVDATKDGVQSTGSTSAAYQFKESAPPLTCVAELGCLQNVVLVSKEQFAVGKSRAHVLAELLDAGFAARDFNRSLGGRKVRQKRQKQNSNPP